MSQPPANERVRQRIAEYVEQHGYGSQKKLAEAIPAKFGEPRSSAWVSDVLSGRLQVRLKDLDALAAAMGVQPGELVRRADRNFEELTMAESRLLRYFRGLPETVRHNFMTFLDYFFRSSEQATQGMTPARKRGIARKRRAV